MPDKMTATVKIGNAEIRKSLVYSLERKYGCADVSYDEPSETLSFRLLPGGSDDLRQEIEAYILEFLAPTDGIADRIQPQILHRHLAHPTVSSDPIEKLRSAEVQSTDISGVHWIGSAGAAIMQRLDKLFLMFAKEFGAETILPSALISTSDLERCGYLSKGYHQLGFVHTKDSECGDQKDLGVCLTPSACLSTYPALKGRNLTHSNAVYTFASSVFRREAGRFSTESPLARVWEFSVREIIFFGDSAFREAVKNRYFQFLSDLGRKLRLSYEIATASDVFFHPEQSSLALFQLLKSTKYEFLFVNGDSRLALSSFNCHGRQFVNAFQICPSDHQIESFCIGFGLQRWLQSLLVASSSVGEVVSKLDSVLSCAQQLKSGSVSDLRNSAEQ